VKAERPEPALKPINEKVFPEKKRAETLYGFEGT